MANELKITLNDDGTVSLDARGMKGKDATILAELKSLAGSIGGDLTVEKHVGKHDHSHSEGTHEHA